MAGFSNRKTMLIPPDKIVKIELKDQPIRTCAVDLRWTVERVKQSIGKKLPNLSDISQFGIFEFDGNRELRVLSPNEALNQAKQSWEPNGHQYKFVFQRNTSQSGNDNNKWQAKAAAQDENTKWKQKLADQQNRMSTLNKRMSRRMSTRGKNDSYADQLKVFEIQQMEKRMTMLQSNLEREELLKNIEEAEDRKKAEEEKLLKEKTASINNKMRRRPSTFRVPDGSQFDFDSVTDEKTKETEQKLKEIEEKIKDRDKKRVAKETRKKKQQLEMMEKKIREMEKELDSDVGGGTMSESQMNAEMEKRQREEQEWEEQLQREKSARAKARDRKKKEREARLEGQRKDLESKLETLEKALTDKDDEKAKNQELQEQRKVDVLNAKIKQMNEELESNDSSDQKEMEEELSLAEKSLSLSRREREIKEREEKIQKLEEKTDAMDAVFEKLKFLEGVINQPGFGTGGGAPIDPRGAEALKKEIEELQKVLMDPNSTDQKLEDANIKLEKALDAYERTPECIADKKKAKDEKAAKEEPLNRDALNRMKSTYNIRALKSDTQLLEKVKKHPELRLIMMDPTAISQKHERDFDSFSLAGISLDELRAIRGAMPKFNSAQAVQLAFLDTLDNKIQDKVKNPAPTRKPGPAKKLRLPKAGKSGGSPSSLFDEIKRKGGKGGLKRSKGPQKKKMSESNRDMGSGAATPAASRPAMPALPPPGPDPGMIQNGATNGGSPLDAAVGSLATCGQRLITAASGSASEKEIAASTKALVAEMKKVSSLAKGKKPEQCKKLDQMASMVVVKVKEVLSSKSNPSQKDAAVDKLSAVVNKVTSLGREAL